MLKITEAPSLCQKHLLCVLTPFFNPKITQHLSTSTVEGFYFNLTANLIHQNTIIQNKFLRKSKKLYAHIAK